MKLVTSFILIVPRNISMSNPAFMKRQRKHIQHFIHITAPYVSRICVSRPQEVENLIPNFPETYPERLFYYKRYKNLFWIFFFKNTRISKMREPCVMNIIYHLHKKFNHCTIICLMFLSCEQCKKSSNEILLSLSDFCTRYKVNKWHNVRNRFCIL